MGGAGTIKMGSDASWVAYDRSDGYIYVVNLYGISVISASTQIPEFPGFMAAIGVAFAAFAGLTVERKLRDEPPRRPGHSIVSLYTGWIGQDLRGMLPDDETDASGF